MNTVLDRRHVVVVVRTLSVLVVASGVTWLALPSPIGSLAWIPSPAPALDGAYQTNGLLTAAEHIYTDVVTGPEDIAFDHEGRASTGLSDGRIVRLNADGTVTDLAHTGGRPLGLEYAPDGTLYVADARRGLLRVDLATRAVTVLLDKAEGIAFHCVNDLEIAKDGTLYFSDSSAVWGLDQATEDILDQRPSGRVLKYDPRTDSDALVLARDLVFANGLALSLDEKQLFIAETGRYRIWRLWLSGDKKNLKEVVIENLPGFPDNLDMTPRGTIWVALISTRKRAIDWMQPYPFLKDATASLPRWLRPEPPSWGFVVEFDSNGLPLRSLQDPGGKQVPHVSAAKEHDGQLWLGNLDDDHLSRLRL